MKKIIIIGAITVIGIIIILGAVNKHSDSLRQQKYLNDQAIQARYKYAFDDCIQKAEQDHIRAEVDYCETNGGTNQFCESNPTNILGGYIGQNYQNDKANCAKQFPGAD